jgi:hypothetical protein
MAKLDMEIESRPGKVVLRFTKGGDTTDYALSADGAEQLADNIQRAVDKARQLE